MPISTITSKGQTTIPLKVRKFLNLDAGDRIEFIIEADGRVILAPANVNAADLKGILPKPKKAVTMEEMKAAIRQRAKE